MPFLPKTNRDNSAWFEHGLAEQLRELKPEFDVTRVDLSPFLRPRAKIDYLIIRQPRSISKFELESLKHSVVGSVEHSNLRPRDATIHDPTQADLHYLLTAYPRACILETELAVDMLLPEGCNDVYLLRQLKEQFHHCLAPHRHPLFKGAERVYWDSSRNRRSPDGASNLAPLTTFYYQSNKNGLSLKIYLKTLDQGTVAQRYCLRVELKMIGTAPEWAGLSTVSDLPRFGKELRSFTSKAFFVGSGFKSEPVERTKWTKYGACWTINEDKGLVIQPDVQVNRVIGEALNDLGRSLQRLAPHDDAVESERVRTKSKISAGFTKAIPSTFRATARTSMSQGHHTSVS